MPSPYISNTDADRTEMLDAIGVSSSADLFLDIPEAYRDPALDIPRPLSEMELLRELKVMARRNADLDDYACFLGAGSYNHYIPSVVRHITGRSEFYTSYTPYQAEISQGTLQTTYDFQSLVCRLTGMDVANAGMYDGSTALAEAALMACRITRRKRVVALDTVSPGYLEILNSYMEPQDIDVQVMSPSALNVTEETACLICQYPDFYGIIEDLGPYAEASHRAGALLVASADPIALGMFRSPGEYDADIVVGEGQCMGTSPTFGGPYLGLFAARSRHMRQMPGRIVGKTTDARGREGFVLTLQTREQHIRRETATSNICTSEALVALALTAYLAALGPRGLRSVAQLSYHKAHYAAQQIAALPGYSLPVKGDFFKEFVIQCPRPPSEINRALLKDNIIGGLDLTNSVRPEPSRRTEGLRSGAPNSMLLCVTEMNTRDQIDSLVLALSKLS
ncbi:MAG: aminomethyl-transferring glycine dehydrogenase subunit GcvPA [Chloroflexi bacterium]|nr:aminomethyl-transferring glycine dehydrogenase subunit GcvPA [Chloroflexota bacterium]